MSARELRYVEATKFGTYWHGADWQIASDGRNEVAVVPLALFKRTQVVVSTFSAETRELLHAQAAEGLVAALVVSHRVV